MIAGSCERTTRQSPLGASRSDWPSSTRRTVMWTLAVDCSPEGVLDCLAWREPVVDIDPVLADIDLRLPAARIAAGAASRIASPQRSARLGGCGRGGANDKHQRDDE